MSYTKDLKKVMILYPDLEINSSDDYRELVNIHNTAESIFGNRSVPIVTKAYENRSSLKKFSSSNDYYYLLFLTLSKDPSFKKIKKFAYPNQLDGNEISNEFDIDKWASLVHKIYDAVKSGHMDMESAIDYYADTLNTKVGEDLNFKKWIKYYQSGEHLKYSKNKAISKTAFQFSLGPPADPYATNSYGIPSVFQKAEESLKEVEKNPPDANPDASEEKKLNYRNWKEKLNTAIRRIDRLIRQGDEHIDNELQSQLAALLFDFDQAVRGLKYQTTASDIASNYANKFKKLGFMGGYNELRKYAQQADAPAPSVESDAPAAPAAAPAEATTPAAEPGTEQAAEGAEEPQDSKTPLEKALEPVTEKKEGEYESLAGNVTLTDAIAKLEDIASRLSDRRTIRLLAEFDIILDKIGIAPMFPELAEAQSKLIDAYSYALVRVTKMLGMLSSGKSVMEISDVKKKELINKTMKEVNKSIEGAEATPEDEGSPERGTESIQEGIQKQKQAPAEPETPAETAPQPKV